MRARWLAVIVGLFVLGGVGYFIHRRHRKPPRPTTPDMAALANGLAAGLDRDPFFDHDGDQLRVLARRDALTAPVTDDTTTDIRVERLRTMYMLVLGDVQVLGHAVAPDARAEVRREIDRWVAQARAEAKLLGDRGDVPPGFALAQFVSNIRFLGAVAWLEEQTFPDAACRAALQQCAAGPCVYQAVARQALAAAPVDEYDAGLTAWDAGDYKAAVAHFTAHLARAKDDEQALTWRGLARLRLGDLTHAKADFAAALAKAPDDAVALEGSGHAAFRSGDTAGAIAAWQRAAQTSPERAPTLRAYIAAAGGPR